MTQVRNSNLNKVRKSIYKIISPVRTEKRCYEKGGIKYVTDLCCTKVEEEKEDSHEINMVIVSAILSSSP